jgi:hypothetical protein
VSERGGHDVLEDWGKSELVASNDLANDQPNAEKQKAHDSLKEFRRRHEMNLNRKASLE